MLFKLFVCVLPSQSSSEKVKRVARVSIFDTRMSSLPLTRVENVLLNFAGMSFTMCVKISILNYAFTVLFYLRFCSCFLTRFQVRPEV